MTTPTRTTLTAGLAALALTGTLAGCNLAKTGAVPTGANDIVTVLPITFGTATTLLWDTATLRALRSAGLTLAPTGSAVATTLGPAGVAFPITTGYAEIHQLESQAPASGTNAPPDTAPDLAVKPGWVQGSLYHEGSGLTITAAASSASSSSSASSTATSPMPAAPPQVTLSDFVVDPGSSVLYGTVDGKLPQVPLMTLDGAKVSLAATNSGAIGGSYADTQGSITLDGSVARLTPQAASLLDSTFSTSAITAGTELGTVKVALSGEPVTYDANDDKVTALSRLTGQGTTLTLEPSAASALQGLGISATPAGKAKADGAAFTFPITGGMVAIHADHGFDPGYVVGSVLHQSSGLVLSDSAGTALSMGDFVVDPGDGVLYATVGGARNVPLLSLDGSHLTVSASGGAVTLDGTVALLTSQAASALDSTFSTRAFTAGAALGTVHLVATGQPGS